MFDSAQEAANAYRVAAAENERALAAVAAHQARMREIDLWLRGRRRVDLVRALARWRATVRDPQAHARYRRQLDELLRNPEP